MPILGTTQVNKGKAVKPRTISAHSWSWHMLSSRSSVLFTTCSLFPPQYCRLTSMCLTTISNT